MPEGIDLLRKAARRNAARAVGQHPEQPRLSVTQLRAAGNESDILTFPVDISGQQTLQDITPGSATFGLFYFMPGLDTPGDTTKIIR